MTADPITSGADSVSCWCCNCTDRSDRMVALGQHPEVHLCLRCAHFVHQRARQIEDEGESGLAVLARDRIRELRGEVMRRGLHHNRFIGGALRRLGKHLP